mmetsp:Transcript_12078/g.28938  ORF Transcript_12078/g.28938 Transcript_12078/m.28938 type:complete len:265 (+) Transcript_12078:101-895(+)
MQHVEALHVRGALREPVTGILHQLLHHLVLVQVAHGRQQEASAQKSMGAVHLLVFRAVVLLFLLLEKGSPCSPLGQRVSYFAHHILEVRLRLRVSRGLRHGADRALRIAHDLCWRFVGEVERQGGDLGGDRLLAGDQPVDEQAGRGAIRRGRCGLRQAILSFSASAADTEVAESLLVRSFLLFEVLFEALGDGRFVLFGTSALELHSLQLGENDPKRGPEHLVHLQCGQEDLEEDGRADDDQQHVHDHMGAEDDALSQCAHERD